MTTFEGWLYAEDQATKDMLDTVQQYLAGVERAGYRLIAHQTSAEQALKIIRSEDFSNQGVEGTALFANSGEIRHVIEKMYALHSGDKATYQAMGGLVHKHSNAVLVMVIPTSLRVRGMRELDDVLVDLNQTGKIRTFGIPNQYIVGYWQWDGKFFANGKFNPKGLM